MTLRCIAGIETPDQGKIVINGKTVFDSRSRNQSETTEAADWLPLPELCIISDYDGRAEYPLWLPWRKIFCTGKSRI